MKSLFAVEVGTKMVMWGSEESLHQKADEEREGAGRRYEYEAGHIGSRGSEEDHAVLIRVYNVG